MRALARRVLARLLNLCDAGATMAFLLIAGMLVCGWVFLCVLSGERERRVLSGDTDEPAAAGMAPAPSPAGHGLSGAGGQREKLTKSEAPTRV